MTTEPAGKHLWFTHTLQKICHEKGIAVRGLSQNWLWELEKDGVKKRILGTAFDLNDSMASNIGRDKVATYELLKAYNIPAVPHFVAGVQNGKMVVKALNWSDGIVVKPLNGQSGKGVWLFYNRQKAVDSLPNIGFRWAVSPLAAIAAEIRVVLLDGEVMLQYAKQPTIINGLKVFNLSKKAKLLKHDLAAEEKTIAQKAQKVLGLRLCAVDLVRLESGELRVLEINSGITLASYAAYSAENARWAKKVYEKIIAAMFA